MYAPSMSASIDDTVASGGDGERIRRPGPDDRHGGRATLARHGARHDARRSLDDPGQLHLRRRGSPVRRAARPARTLPVPCARTHPVLDLPDDRRVHVPRPRRVQRIRAVRRACAQSGRRRRHRSGDRRAGAHPRAGGDRRRTDRRPPPGVGRASAQHQGPRRRPPRRRRPRDRGGVPRRRRSCPPLRARRRGRRLGAGAARVLAGPSGPGPPRPASQHRQGACRTRHARAHHPRPAQRGRGRDRRRPSGAAGDPGQPGARPPRPPARA